MKKIFRAFSVFAAMWLTGTQANAQCPYPADNCSQCLDVTMPPSPTICPGSSYVLNLASCITIPPGMTLTDWLWAPYTLSAGVSPVSGALPSLPGITTFTPGTSMSYTLTLHALGPDLINDGSFTSFLPPPSVPCFTTDYPYYSGTAMLANTLYSVGTNPASLAPGYFTSMGDHTTGTGNMMIVNGSTKKTPTAVVWQEKQIPVCEGQDYEFKMWYANIDPPGGGPQTADLTVDINGTIYTPFTVGAPGVWVGATIPWTAPTGTTSVTIKILDVDYSDNFNDFALDDISFRRKCTVVVPFTVNVDPTKISGPQTVCVNNQATLTGLSAGGTWSWTGSAVTVSPSGVVTGVTPGTATITYTTPLGCIATKIIHVDPNPIVMAGGPTSICVGGLFSVSATPAGGTWSNSSEVLPSVAPYYVGVSPGVGTVTYTLNACYGTFMATINPVPDIAPVYTCSGTVSMLSGSPGGGTWSCATAGVISVTSGGVLTTIAPGTAVVTYTLPTGCFDTAIVHVFDCPHDTIFGPVPCVGNTTTLTGVAPGGTWSSSDPSIATIDVSTGVLTGVSAGTVTITYTVGGSIITQVIEIVVQAAACAHEVSDIPPSYPITGGPYLVFSSTCPATASCIIEYLLYDVMGNYVGHSAYYPYTYSPGVLPYSTLYGYLGCSQAYYLCVTGVWCGGCHTDTLCCINLNDPNWHPKSETNSIAAVYHDVSVVPNPTTGSFALKGYVWDAEDIKDVTIEVIDMLGKTVYTDVTTLDHGVVDKNITLDAGLADGMYLVKLKGGGKSQVLRFILNR